MADEGFRTDGERIGAYLEALNELGLGPAPASPFLKARVEALVEFLFGDAPEMRHALDRLTNHKIAEFLERDLTKATTPPPPTLFIAEAAMPTDLSSRRNGH